MSATLSEATGRPYGIQRVCQAWERSRSALYARQTREQQRHKGEEPARRGPTPTVSDATLLEAIQADLDRSPFQGEGHRKVHARLRILDGIRVARTRVLRVMRAHKLLSPHRGRQGTARVHAGTIVHAGAERDVGHRRRAGLHVGRRVGLDLHSGRALERGVCGMARVQGWEPVCGARADRPGALRRIYGALDADSARGLALRMDHGSQYLSDHFLNPSRLRRVLPFLTIEGAGQGSRLETAMAHRDRAVTEAFRARPNRQPVVHVQMSEGELLLVPTHLLGAIWVQLAAAIEDDKRFRRCPARDCPLLWFEVSTGPLGVREDAEFCSARCRHTAYRDRKTSARQMRRDGVSLEDIARSLKTDVRRVRSWVAKKPR